MGRGTEQTRRSILSRAEKKRSAMGRRNEQKGREDERDPVASRRKIQEGNEGKRSRSTEEVAAEP